MDHYFLTLGITMHIGRPLPIRPCIRTAPDLTRQIRPFGPTEVDQIMCDVGRALAERAQGTEVKHAD